MPNLQMPEIILLVLVLVLLFGAKKLPDTARGLGRSLRIFKAETKGLRDDEATDGSAATPASSQTPGQAPTQAEAPRPIAPAQPPADGAVPPATGQTGHSPAASPDPERDTR